MMAFSKLLFTLTLFWAGFVVAGCSDDTTTQPDGDTHVHMHAHVLYYNAAAGYSSMNLVIDDVVIAIRENRVLNENYAEFEAGDYGVALTETGSTDPVAETTYSFVKDNYYTAFAIANSDGEASAMILDDDLTAPSDGMARVRLANLSPDAPQVKVAVPGSGSGPIFNQVGFASTSGDFIEMAPGEYNLRVQDAGTSGGGGGAGGLIPDTQLILDAGNIYTIALVGTLSDDSGELILIKHTPVTE